MSAIIFDESHAETWTLDKSLALTISPDNPENSYYGHLAGLLRDELKLVSAPMRTWDVDLLHDSRLLIIAHPSVPDVKPSLEGSPLFSAKEIEQVRKFVEEGGGLLVIGEHNYPLWRNNLNELMEPYGIQFNSDTVMRPRAKGDPILVRHFSIAPAPSHPVSENVREITYHRGCSLTLSATETDTIVAATPNNEVVCAAKKYGKGRVAAIGDSDIFSLPYIGHSDNVRLFTNLICWLLDEKNIPIVKRDVVILQKGANLQEFPKRSDLRLFPGNHLSTLNHDEATVRLLASIRHDPFKEREAFLEECEFKFHQLPEQLRRAVIKFRRHSNKFGVLLLQGLPLDPELPATPTDQRPPDKKTFWSETWLAMIGQTLGDLIGYSIHHHGAIFQNACPIKKQEYTQTTHSSEVFLRWHTEQVFHPARPDFLCLLCLRADRDDKAETEVASIKSILAEIPISMRQVLFQPRFRAGVDLSPNGDNRREDRPLVPILSGQAYDPFFAFDPGLIEPADRESAVAFQRVRDTLNQVYNYIKLRPGEMLIVDNRRAVHGRSVFKAYYDGEDRWLQRVYVVRDLAATNEERDGSERINDMPWRHFRDRSLRHIFQSGFRKVMERLPLALANGIALRVKD
jgi:alpha-ketoglutarate-dependent taurine dioxygenase